ncbi:MAG: hypothetical protein D6785_02560, partial [Planctomycetota bacterium]
SRKIYGELVKKGKTTYKYVNHDLKESPEILLYLLGRKKEKIHLNQKLVEVTFLVTAGGEKKKNPPKRPWEKVDPITLPDKGWNEILNKWKILDSAKYPLSHGYFSSRAYLQTAITGMVKEAKTNQPVGGAWIEVVSTRAKGRSWPSGYFRLPLIRKRFQKFKVRVRCDGYKPWEKTIDFSLQDVLPLQIRLEKLPPKVSPQKWVWISKENLPQKISQIPSQKWIHSLIRASLQEYPKSWILAPAQRIPYGYASTYGYWIFTEEGLLVTVTEDGLKGASAISGFLTKTLAGYAKKASQKAMDKLADNFRGLASFAGKTVLREATGIEVGKGSFVRGVIGLFAGYWASWYAYSAGRLDAISKEVFEGRKIENFGHNYALRFAYRFYKDLMARAGKFFPPSFKLGFKIGLFTLRKIMDPRRK